MSPLLRFVFSALAVQVRSNPLPTRISCAFKWAQSAEHVHIFVKFAHKIDAPAPNDCKKEAVDISTREVRFNATNQIKRYNFGVKLLLAFATACDCARCFASASAFSRASASFLLLMAA